MPLNTIPVLPEDHPLYDWADYQSSRDALVKGTPTKQFAKEAWNAIVDSLSEALTVAGLEWDNTYTTAAGARITTSPGKLSAAAFNSVRLNIDRPAPLGWAWAWNGNFRGYVGRENFRGRATHRKSCDRVYPEYIIELVRKLNLLLEIMRETALLADAEMEHIVSVLIQAEAQSRPSLPVNVDHISHTQASAEVRPGQGSSAELMQKSGTRISAEGIPDKAASASVYVKNPLLIYAEGHPVKVLPMEPTAILIDTKISVEAQTVRYKEAEAKAMAHSLLEAEADMNLSFPFEEEIKTGSVNEIEAHAAESLPTESSVLAGSRCRAEADKVLALPTGSTVLFTSLQEATADTRLTVPMAAVRLSGTHISCKVDSAWYPPVWVDGGLWIRQSHRVTQNENGELVIM